MGAITAAGGTATFVAADLADPAVGATAPRLDRERLVTGALSPVDGGGTIAGGRVLG